MPLSEIIESMGFLLKEESLQIVEHCVLQNTLVLENLEPFPGYHGENLPCDTKPDSLFLITDKQYSAESILRISSQLCALAKIAFDACPAEIFMYNTQLFGIRIRGLSNYSLISEIQNCYVDHGIKFMKKRKINATGLIRINKIFCLEKLAEHIYKDLDDEKTFYLSVPMHLNWNLFKQAVRQVKNNLDNSNFDCASGFIYLKTIFEFVRIYTQHAEIPRLKTIREKFLEEITRIQEQ
jgi:hypothetical protein